MIGLAAAAVPAAAQSTTGYKAVADTSSVYKIMHDNAPSLRNIPDVPRFALMGKDNKFYMGIGVNVRATAGYDLGHPIESGSCFTTYDIPMNQAPGNGGRFQVNAQQSALYLNVVALPGTKDQVGLFAEFTLNGNNYNPSLQYAYLKYRGITAGYTYSVFTDAAVGPATIDFEGPCGYAFVINPGVNWQGTFGAKKEWGVGVGLETPMLSATTSGSTSTVSQRVPDIPAYVQYSWAKGAGHFRVSGILRNLYYRDQVADHNVDKVGWGLQASGMSPIAGGLSCMFSAVYGKGVSSYFQDLTDNGLDLTPDGKGHMDAVKSWGGFAGLQYNFSPSVFCSATYSHCRTYADRYAGGSTPWGEQYRYAQYLVSNVFWNVNSFVQTGVEYLYGRRVDYSGQQAHDNRIQAMIQVSF